MNDLAAVFDQFDLALNFAVDRFFDEAERVDVLDLAAGAEFSLTKSANRHVAVATQRTFGHVAVANAQVAHEGVHGFYVGHGFFGAAHVRLGDDFQQWRARTVQVDAGGAAEIFVQAFACVFFQMCAGNADAFDRAVFKGDVQVALADNRQLHLADLITLGQVRVEVVFARKDVVLNDLGINGQAEHHGHAHGFFVEHRQHARHAQVNQAGLSVRLRAKGGGATGENFRLGGELGVNFQPDHNFPLHMFLLRSRQVSACASQC